MVITFAGHSVIAFRTEIKEKVKAKFRENVPKDEPIICYIGEYGDFDAICACACRDLRSEYPNIELVYVTPYMSLSEQKKIKQLQEIGAVDSIVYPPIENTPPKFAILKRNEWMVFVLKRERK